MNLLLKILRFSLITTLVLPLWVLGCVVIFLFSVLSYYLFSGILKTEQEDDNNIDNIIFNFKLNVISVFIIY
jgi:ABC-type dipeptide/oligopeptide/nickel transport system permease component